MTQRSRLVSIDGVAGVWMPEATAGSLAGHVAARRNEVLQRYGVTLPVGADVQAFAELVDRLAAFRECSADETIRRSMRSAGEASTRDLLDAKQAADRIGCSETNVRARARRGTLPSVRRAPWLFDPAVIDDECARSRAS